MRVAEPVVGVTGSVQVFEAVGVMVLAGEAQAVGRGRDLQCCPRSTRHWPRGIGVLVVNVWRNAWRMGSGKARYFSRAWRDTGYLSGCSYGKA